MPTTEPTGLPSSSVVVTVTLAPPAGTYFDWSATTFTLIDFAGRRNTNRSASGLPLLSFTVATSTPSAQLGGVSSTDLVTLALRLVVTDAISVARFESVTV